MRFIFSILFLLLSGLIAAQEAEVRTMTLREAINHCATMNPDSSMKETGAALKSAWYDMLYHIHSYSLMQEYLDQLYDLDRITGLKYRSGELDVYEASSLLGIYADVKTNTAIEANGIEADRNLLGYYTGFSIIPADSAFDLYEIDKSTSEVSSDSENRIIDPLYAISLANKRLQLDNLFIKIEYFRSFALEHADITDHTGFAKFNAEDIDYIAYIKMLHEALDIRLKYLETLNQYNQLAIEFEIIQY